LIGPRALGAPIDIRAVGEEKGDQMDFLKLPWKIYTEDHNWVPPMITDVETIFDHKENIFYAHGEAKAFIAYRGNEMVGRIVAAVDHRANRYHNERAGFFGFFEVDRTTEPPPRFRCRQAMVVRPRYEDHARADGFSQFRWDGLPGGRV